ncbi:MAG: hypothetical protein HONBIEJF_01494 [Fimbriimonadaceae bacterium]|nr:hypothetical protein [Fimbriimonadaceae bacterium]
MHIALISLLLMQTAAAKVDEPTKAERLQAMTALSREIEAEYVEIDLAKTIAKAIQDWTKTKEFDGLQSNTEFADKVNALLKSKVTDAHFRFRYIPNGIPKRERPGEPSAEEMKRYREIVRMSNANFEKVERLPGNIGYVKFNGFAEPADMAQPLEGAMRFLGNCDAFIVDLRSNGGGSPSGVQLFCSYFFDEKPVHLNNIYFRQADKLTKTEFWTLKEVKGPRFPNAALYVLTSKRTGSGAEECAYNFQQLKRGTIIGEPTWGGANPGGMVRLTDHFACFIPSGKAENPHSKKNWEAVGVIPDVAVSPADGLKTAQVMALKSLIEKATDAELKKELESLLKGLQDGD